MDLIDRWAEGDSRAALLAALKRGDSDWPSILEGMPLVNEVDNGRDLRGVDSLFP